MKRLLVVAVAVMVALLQLETVTRAQDSLALACEYFRHNYGEGQRLVNALDLAMGMVKWEDKDETASVMAKFLKVEDGKVHLLSNDGRTIVIDLENLNFKSRSRIARINTNRSQIVAKFEEQVKVISLKRVEPTGRSSNGQLKVIREFGLLHDSSPLDIHNFSSVDFSADAQSLILIETFGRRRGPRLVQYDAENGRYQNELFAPTGIHGLLRLSHEGPYARYAIWFSSANQDLSVWDIASKEEHCNFKDLSRKELPTIRDKLGIGELGGGFDEPGGIALNSSGSSAFVGGAKGALVQYDTKSGKTIREFAGATNMVDIVTLTPDDSRLVAASGSWIYVWEVSSGKLIQSWIAHKTDFANLGVTWLAVHPQGTRILSSGWDGALCLWNAETGEKVQSFKGHSDIIWDVTFSADGKYALSASGGKLEGDVLRDGSDNSVRLWEVDSGKEIDRIEKLSGPAGDVEFSPDMRFAAILFDNKILLTSIPDLQTGKSLEQ